MLKCEEEWRLGWSREREELHKVEAHLNRLLFREEEFWR